MQPHFGDGLLANGERHAMSVDRRRVLQAALGAGALGALALPARWIRPVVDTIVVPAHAQSSPIPTIMPTGGFDPNE